MIRLYSFDGERMNLGIVSTFHMINLHIKFLVCHIGSQRIKSLDSTKFLGRSYIDNIVIMTTARNLYFSFYTCATCLNP